MKGNYIFLLCLIFTTSVYCQKPTSKIPLLNQPKTDNKNYLPTIWNQIIGTSELKITKSNSGESLMGNFVCEAMLARTQADFAFISHSELYADLYRGNITQLDMFRLFPFSRTLVVIEMSGDTLKQIVERTIGSLQSGLAIAGGIVEYDPNRPAQNRLTYFQVGQNPLYPKKEYRVVTIDYHADGFAGFEILKEIDPGHIFRTGIILREILSDYIGQNSPLDDTKVRLDNRWVKK